MSGATINSILARCILDTAFLDQLASDPSAALTEYALEPQVYSDFLKLDVERVRHFAGLVTKVQNNGLWEHFLHTRTLLNYYGIDLEVFTAYRDTHLQNREAHLSRNQQVERFLSFLRTYLEPKYSKYPALREVLLHEQLTWEIRLLSSKGMRRRSDTRKVDIASLKPDQLMKVIPVIPDLLRLEEFTCDPSAVISDLTQGQFKARLLKTEFRWLGYWADNSTGQLRILELDSPVASLLKEVNGRRSIRTLIQRVLKDLPFVLGPSDFRPFLDFAFAEGLLAVSAGNSSG